MHRTFSKILSNKGRYALDNDQVDLQDDSLMAVAKKDSKSKKKKEPSLISVIHSFLPQLARFN
jgi:hypothetical protein